MSERKDKRGAPPGDQSKPGGQRRAGTEHAGKMGNLPHERNEDAAKQIEILAGFGLPQNQITLAVESIFKDQGYSPDTLARHYRAELDAGMAKAKVALMQGAYDRALGRNLPDGVSPDTAYREGGRSIEWLLNAVHKVVPHQSHRLGGPDGGAIPVEYRNMTDEEVEERIKAHEESRAGHSDD